MEERDKLSLTRRLVCNNTGLCGDIPAGVTPDTHSSYGCSTALEGTLLGSECPTSPPTALMSPTSAPSSSPTEPSFSPTSVPGDQPLKENWSRKRAVARKEAFPQKYSWFRKQANQDSQKISCPDSLYDILKIRFVVDGWGFESCQAANGLSKVFDLPPEYTIFMLRSLHCPFTHSASEQANVSNKTCCRFLIDDTHNFPVYDLFHISTDFELKM